MQGALIHSQDRGHEPVYPSSDLEEELLRVRDYERRRLGQELHDTAGQLLVSLLFSVRRLRAMAEGAVRAQLLDEIVDAIGGIDQEIRSLAYLEYPVELGDRNLFSAVRTLASGIEKRTGFHISFRAVGDQSSLAMATSAAMLRVAQEALVNVHRHACASLAKVVLERRPDSLYLSVSDNGVGMPAFGGRGDAAGLGLNGMRYRVEALGGKFRITNLRQGTKISATVPLG